MRTAILMVGALALVGMSAEEPVQELRVSYSGLN